MEYKYHMSINQLETDAKIVEVVYTYNTTETDHMGMMLGDVFGLLLSKEIKFNHVINILKIRVDPEFRGKGYAKRILTNALKQFDKPGNIIVIRSAPLMDDYPEEPNNEIYEKELCNQASFLEYMGFRNINSLCGFEQTIPYVYVSKNSMEFLKAIQEIEIVSEKLEET